MYTTLQTAARQLSKSFLPLDHSETIDHRARNLNPLQTFPSTERRIAAEFGPDDPITDSTNPTTESNIPIESSLITSTMVDAIELPPTPAMNAVIAKQARGPTFDVDANHLAQALEQSNSAIDCGIQSNQVMLATQVCIAALHMCQAFHATKFIQTKSFTRLKSAAAVLVEHATRLHSTLLTAENSDPLAMEINENQDAPPPNQSITCNTDVSRSSASRLADTSCSSASRLAAQKISHFSRQSSALFHFPEPLDEPKSTTIDPQTMHAATLAYQEQCATRHERRQKRPPRFRKGEIIGARDSLSRWWMARIEAVVISKRHDSPIYYVEFIGFPAQQWEFIADETRLAPFNPARHTQFRASADVIKPEILEI